MQFDLAAARERLRDGIPLVNDHPDVAGMLRDPALVALVGPALADPFMGQNVTAVVSPEARGMIFGALTASALGAGLVLVRKSGRNHPGADIPIESGPTWRGRAEQFQGRSFDLDHHDRVLVVDDWVTTGNSIRAVQNFLKVLGAQYVGSAALVNKAEPATVAELDVHWLVEFEEIGT